MHGMGLLGAGAEGGADPRVPATPVDMSRLLGMDRVGSLLQTVLERLETHEHMLGALAPAELRRTVLAPLTQRVEQQEALQQQLASRMQQAEEDARRAEQESAELRTTVQTLSALLERTRREAEDQRTRAREELEAEVERERRAREEHVGRAMHVTESLTVCLKDVLQRTAVVEEALAGKVDRSDVSRMEALATRLAQFSEFQQGVCDRMDELANKLHEVDGRAHRLQTESNETQENLGRLSQVCERKADKTFVDARCAALDDTVGTLGRDAAAAAQQLFQLNTASERLEDADRQLQAEMQSFVHDQGNRLAAIEERIPKLARADTVITVETFSRALQRLAAEIGDKARVVELEETNNRVQELREARQVSEKQLAIAMRFVDWFSQRGQAYEHNLQRVDEHLAGLAARSVVRGAHPNEAEYGGTVGAPGSAAISPVLRPP